MKCFGLNPENVVRRVQASAMVVALPTFAQSLWLGSVGFCVVSLVVFGSWAFAGRWMFETFDEIGAYAVWAVMFMGGAGGVLSRLVIGPGRLARFYGVFTLAFFLYALAWTVAWVTLRNRSGEWLGSLLGTVAVGVVFSWAFAAWNQFAKIAAILFLSHSAGYFAGDFFYATLHGTMGMLLWGLAYGLGFGLGLGYTLYACQHEVRRQLAGKNT